jgi:hypothetical protein
MADEELPPEEETPPEEPPAEEPPEEEVYPPVIDSILASIKKLLGIEADYTQFDSDIVIHINSAFTNLLQLGVGPSGGFSIVSDEAEWSDFFGTQADIELVKTYIYLKTRLFFDPPQTGYLIEAYNKQILECEWRLNAW